MAGKFVKSLSATTLKAMSVFGGVQFLTILCSVVRNKLVAVWIGPAAMGLLAVYNSAMDMLTTAGQLNLRQSAVRDIAAAPEASRARIIAVVRRLALALGVGGMLLVVAASPLLGYAAFGEWCRWHGFATLSIMMLLSAVASAELAVLQATNRLKRLARAGLWTSLVATAMAIPVFYIWRIEAIVPVILIYSASQCLFAVAERERSQGPRVRVTLRQAWHEGRSILALGFWLTAAMAVTQIASFAFIAWLNRTHGADITGMFQAGYTLVVNYVGVIFTAISMEYYPRLAAAADRGTHRLSVLVAHESRVCLWVIIPMMVAFVLCSELIVRIIYSGAFVDIIPYISIAMCGTLFRAVSWCLAFVMLARGDGRIYIVSETISAALGLALNIVGYSLWGWIGLGAAYVIWYVAYTLIVWIIYRRRYHMTMAPVIWRIVLLGLAVGAATVGVRLLVMPLPTA